MGAVSVQGTQGSWFQQPERGLYRVLYRGTTIGVIKGLTRSLDDGSYRDYEGIIFPHSLLRTSKINDLVPS